MKSMERVELQPSEVDTESLDAKLVEAADRLEALNKKLYDRIYKGKRKSKLVNGKKTKIPGFGYWFKKG